MKSIKHWTALALDEVCYQGGNDDKAHTKQDLISICNGMEDTARALYELLDWRSPSTLLEEWRMEGEVDHDFNLNTSLSIVDRIIKRKKNGIECTEKESAEIKGWLRDTLIMVGSGEVQMVTDIQNLFPQEYGEWVDEDQPAGRDTYEVEYQQYDDGSHVCVALRGDWICDCGPEGDEAAEENAKTIVNALNNYNG